MTRSIRLCVLALMIGGCGAPLRDTKRADVHDVGGVRLYRVLVPADSTICYLGSGTGSFSCVYNPAAFREVSRGS